MSFGVKLFLVLLSVSCSTMQVWSYKSFLCTGRVGVAVISSQIYAIGGYDGLANLSSVEMYDLESEVWSTAPHMNRHQGGVGVAVIPLD